MIFISVYAAKVGNWLKFVTWKASIRAWLLLANKSLTISVVDWNERLTIASSWSHAAKPYVVKIFFQPANWQIYNLCRYIIANWISNTYNNGSFGYEVFQRGFYRMHKRECTQKLLFFIFQSRFFFKVTISKMIFQFLKFLFLSDTRQVLLEQDSQNGCRKLVVLAHS